MANTKFTHAVVSRVPELYAKDFSVRPNFFSELNMLRFKLETNIIEVPFPVYDVGMQIGLANLKFYTVYSS